MAKSNRQGNIFPDFSSSIASSSAVLELGNQLALLIDAGVGFARFSIRGHEGDVFFDLTVPSNSDLRAFIEKHRFVERFGSGDNSSIFITGKLANMVRSVIGGGEVILPAATAWLAARDLIRLQENEYVRSLAIVELSASGYLVVGVDRSGGLKNDLLVVNPRCGAGSGINLDRVLQKLGLGREEVDTLLEAYAGETGRELREKVTVRADRCGVFGSSATISDKNQGIPIDVALATTLKSEVLKVCKKLPSGFEKVYLVGRVFRWKFARDCAEDYLRGIGVRQTAHDPDNSQALKSLHGLIRRLGANNIAQPDARLLRKPVPIKYPSFPAVKQSYEKNHQYIRLQDLTSLQPAELGLSRRSVNVGLDVGSTMAKTVVADAETGELLLHRAYSNAGDTIKTVKLIFQDLLRCGGDKMMVRGIGVTGSARYQVQQALEHIYPELEGRLVILVENFAHARGSIALARERVAVLKELGVDLNEDFCILVDIGGEDTKISTIALREAELFNNAMNLKCSAGTGSLMDTLRAMFGISSIADACAEAFAASGAFYINATCAVFLMENARKLQIQGVPRGDILASANWAIVENMARTLWKQIDLPRKALVLLHGQTMLSEPLPLAVTNRLQSYLSGPVYAMVPPNPGHRACIGLVRTLEQTAPPGWATISPAKLLESTFDKRIVQCHGAACNDPAACCNRTLLTCQSAGVDKPLSFTVGGCSAINELVARKKTKTAVAPVRDTYKEIWDFIKDKHPHSDDADRLVIPRSFCVSEWAYLLSQVFVELGIPVHVDTVHEQDLVDAQPLFNVDSCAPHMGAVGQFRRLANEPHGIILAPQIEFLPTEGKSLGRTCALNQGGIAVGANLAKLARPDARIHLFHLDLSRLECVDLLAQMRDRLTPVFRHYGLSPTDATLAQHIDLAIERHKRLRRDTADLAAEMIEEAIRQGIPVALVVGREYVLNPGIYDSHVRRLLRDKHMVVLPSYVLDLKLNGVYDYVYWRNLHFILTLIDAVAARTLHTRIHHTRLRELFQKIEEGKALLPVVQVSTFSCGPDSVTNTLVAEIMKRRPFLLLQSDAVIKELAHLENRVNTYVKQLELGLHAKLQIGGGQPFEVRFLDELMQQEPVDKKSDVLYIPTLSDNRMITAVLRGAGYNCIDNYDDGYDLYQIVKRGRAAAGDAVCTPLAGMHGDLLRAVDDFIQRHERGDPYVRGKRRLLYFDSKGTGPCRQGMYYDVHRLLIYRNSAAGHGREHPSQGCNALPGQTLLELWVGQELQGYDAGLEEWVLARIHQGLVVQGVLHELLFAGGTRCHSYDEYQSLLADYQNLKTQLFRAFEDYAGPSQRMKSLLDATSRQPYLGALLNSFAYRLISPELMRPIRQFANRWLRPARSQHLIKVFVAGEGYMRVAQVEDIFRILLANIGFDRFKLEYTPAWSYVEFLIDYEIYVARDVIERQHADRPAGAENRTLVQKQRALIRRAELLRFILRQIIARPLYAAARLSMPISTAPVLRTARELLPTLRPLDELVTYVGEAISELRSGTDVLLNVAPNGCLVAEMGEILTPCINHVEGAEDGRIQHLFSADGDVDEELLTLALLKTLGAERYYSPSPTCA